MIVGAVATRASGHAERLAAQHLIEPHADDVRRVTLGGDKGFDTQDFVAEMREINVTPHVAQNDRGRRSAIDGRTTRHPGYAVSLRIRKRIEEAFGWAPRRSPVCARRVTVGCPGSIGSSPSPWPPTIWFGCPSCWRRRRDARSLSKSRRRGRNLPQRACQPNPPQPKTARPGHKPPETEAIFSSLLETTRRASCRIEECA